MAVSQPKAYIHQPTIRRVLKQGGVSICGLCRRRYKDASAAQSCLLACWQQVRQAYPLILRRTGYKPPTGIDTSKTVFRCRFCSRDFFTEAEGLACAERCLNKCQESMTRTQNLPPSSWEVKERRTFEQQFHKVKKDYVPRVAFKRFVDEPAPAPEPEAPVEETEDPLSLEQNKGNGVQKRRHKDHWPKPFIRQNAKYRCAYCLTDYFTKMEVLACFNGHFDGEGLEMDPDSAAEDEA